MVAAISDIWHLKEVILKRDSNKSRLGFIQVDGNAMLTKKYRLRERKNGCVQFFCLK